MVYQKKHIKHTCLECGLSIKRKEPKKTAKKTQDKMIRDTENKSGVD